MRTRQRIQNFLGWAATSSFDLVVTRGVSRLRVQEARYGIGDLINGDGKHGRRIGRATTVSRFALAGVANDDAFVLAFAAVGAVARGICGTVKANDRCAERGCEMQRPGIRRDYKFRAVD